MLRKNVKSLLEQLQVSIFAEIVFGVRRTLKEKNISERSRCVYLWRLGNFSSPLGLNLCRVGAQYLHFWSIRP